MTDCFDAAGIGIGEGLGRGNTELEDALGLGTAELDIPAMASRRSSLTWLASIAFRQAVRGVSGAGTGDEVAGKMRDLTVPWDSLYREQE